MASIVDTRPATAAATLAGLIPAVATLLVALDWWNPTDGELVAVTGALTVIIGILGKFVASVVYCRATVKDLLGPVDPQPVPVTPGSPSGPPPPPPPPPAPAPAGGPPVVTQEITPDMPLGGTPASLEEYVRRTHGESPPT